MTSRAVLQAFAIILVGGALGALNKGINPNAPNWIGFYPVSSASDTAKIPESAQPDDPPFVSVGDAASLFNKPGVLFVDARDEYDYKVGHVKGAVNVPFEGDPKIKDDFMAKTPKDQEMVIYCAGADCDLSLYLGRTLKLAGFSRVHIFFGGWSDWQLQKMPTDSVPGNGVTTGSGEGQ